MEQLRKIITGLVALAAGLVFSHPAHAAAPMQKGQAGGFYRMKLGDFEVVGWRGKSMYERRSHCDSRALG